MRLLRPLRRSRLLPTHRRVVRRLPLQPALRFHRCSFNCRGVLCRIAHWLRMPPENTCLPFSPRQKPQAYTGASRNTPRVVPSRMTTCILMSPRLGIGSSFAELKFSSFWCRLIHTLSDVKGDMTLSHAPPWPFWLKPFLSKTALLVRVRLLLFGVVVHLSATAFHGTQQEVGFRGQFVGGRLANHFEGTRPPATA